MQLGKLFVTLRTTTADIAGGLCANRSRCVIANTINRQFGLGGKGYIRVDANAWSATVGDKRFVYHPPKPMMTYLRKFDLVGERRGVEAARAYTKPAAFKCRLLEVKPVAPPANPKRKVQINKARRAREAQQKADGTYQPKRLRYAGV